MLICVNWRALLHCRTPSQRSAGSGRRNRRGPRGGRAKGMPCTPHTLHWPGCWPLTWNAWKGLPAVLGKMLPCICPVEMLSTGPATAFTRLSRRHTASSSGTAINTYTSIPPCLAAVRCELALPPGAYLSPPAAQQQCTVSTGPVQLSSPINTWSHQSWCSNQPCSIRIF